MYGIHRYVNYLNVLIHICHNMSHSITVFPDGSFISDLCLMRDDYSVFNNCAITKEELVFLINHLCTS